MESLDSGGVFASLAFLQERLDAFAEAWGAALLGADGSARSSWAPSSWARGAGARACACTAASATRRRSSTSSIAMVGPACSRCPPRPGRRAVPGCLGGLRVGAGTRAFRVDLVRHRGDGVRTVWTTADAIPEGLEVRTWSIRGTEVRVRYEVRYPGWMPGCESQTETEDVYRLAADGSTFVRAGRRRTTRGIASCARPSAALFDALAAGDRTALGAAVPDARLRARLPATLRSEPACDAPEGSGPDAGVGRGERGRRPSLDADLSSSGPPLAADRRRAGATMTTPGRRRISEGAVLAAAIVRAAPPGSCR